MYVFMYVYVVFSSGKSQSSFLLPNVVAECRVPRVGFPCLLHFGQSGGGLKVVRGTVDLSYFYSTAEHSSTMHAVCII
jgi:hypothetical protein